MEGTEIKEEMKEIEKADKKDIEKVDESIKKLVLSPEFCSWDNDDGSGYEMEIYLPGVDKDSIKLRMTEDTLFVVGETDRARYVGSYTLCCPVEPGKTKSTYKNGLLKIFAPYKDIELSTVNIAID
jgi:HSP20 family molecular chaperone IbpA